MALMRSSTSYAASLEMRVPLAELEARERESTGLTSLKVGYNRVHGYYLETNRRDAEAAPASWVRQTLKNAERFITPSSRP